MYAFAIPQIESDDRFLFDFSTANRMNQRAPHVYGASIVDHGLDPPPIKTAPRHLGLSVFS